MRETRTSGSVGAPGWQQPGATRPRAPDSSSASAVSPSVARVSGTVCRLMVQRSPPATADDSVLPDLPKNASASRSSASARRAATGSLISSTAGSSHVSAGTFCREPLSNSARSAFQSEKPQIVWCEPSDSSRSYDRGPQRARCGFSGETLRDGPLRALCRVLGRLFGTTKPRSPKHTRGPAKAPSRPRRVAQRLPPHNHSHRRRLRVLSLRARPVPGSGARGARSCRRHRYASSARGARGAGFRAPGLRCA